MHHDDAQGKGCRRFQGARGSPDGVVTKSEAGPGWNRWRLIPTTPTSPALNAGAETGQVQVLGNAHALVPLAA